MVDDRCVPVSHRYTINQHTSSHIVVHVTPSYLFAALSISLPESLLRPSFGGSQESTTAAATPTDTENGETAGGANADADTAKVAKRVERFGRIAPMTDNEAAEKMAKRRAKFGLPEPVSGGFHSSVGLCNMGAERFECFFFVCDVCLRLSNTSHDHGCGPMWCCIPLIAYIYIYASHGRIR